MGVAQWPLSKTYAPTPATISDRVINIIFIFVFIFVPPVKFVVNLMLIILERSILYKRPHP